MNAVLPQTSRKRKAEPKTRLIFDRDGAHYLTRKPLPFRMACQKSQFFQKNQRVLRSFVVQGKEGFHVAIYPSSLCSIYKRVMSASKQKAKAEGSEYTFTKIDDMTYSCLSKSGNTYRVGTDGTCDCPHYQTRLKWVGATCKHGVELNAFLLRQ